MADCVSRPSECNQHVGSMQPAVVVAPLYRAFEPRKRASSSTLFEEDQTDVCGGTRVASSMRASVPSQRLLLVNADSYSAIVEVTDVQLSTPISGFGCSKE
jgi:hypothetical protein